MNHVNQLLLELIFDSFNHLFNISFKLFDIRDFINEPWEPIIARSNCSFVYINFRVLNLSSTYIKPMSFWTPFHMGVNAFFFRCRMFIITYLI